MMIRLLYGAVCVRIPMMMLSGGMSASPSSGILTCTGFGSHSDSPTIRPLPAAFAFGAFLPHIPDPPFRICAGRDGFMHGQYRTAPRTGHFIACASVSSPLSHFQRPFGVRV